MKVRNILWKNLGVVTTDRSVSKKLWNRIAPVGGPWECASALLFESVSLLVRRGRVAPGAFIWFRACVRRAQTLQHTLQDLPQNHSKDFNFFFALWKSINYIISSSAFFWCSYSVLFIASFNTTPNLGYFRLPRATVILVSVIWATFGLGTGSP